MRRWTDDIKDWSSRSVAVFKAGERQATMKTAGIHEMIFNPQQSGGKQASKQA